MNYEITTAGGNKITLNTNDPIVAEHLARPSSYTDAVLGQINQHEMYAFALKGRKDLVMLDLGANVGLVSIYAQDVCRRVVAVEPVPESCEILRRLCAPFPNIELVQVALGAVDGTCVFHLNDLNTTASSSVNTYGTKTEFPCVKLSTLLENAKLERVDFCKVDIEGSEADCLTLEEVRAVRGIIRAYYVECHNCPRTTWQHKMAQIKSVFAQSGYGQAREIGDALYAERRAGQKLPIDILRPGAVLDYCHANGLRILAMHAFLYFYENLGSIPGNYLEIGVFEGYMLRELALNYPDKKIYGIDPFIEDGNTIGHNLAVAKGEATVPQMLETEANIKGLSNVRLFKQTSRSWAMETTDAQLDAMEIGAVFVDGDHSYEEASNDLTLALRVLKKGGVIYVDDTGLPSVAKALAEFTAREKDRFIDYTGGGLIKVQGPRVQESKVQESKVQESKGGEKRIGATTPQFTSPKKKARKGKS